MQKSLKITGAVVAIIILASVGSSLMKTTSGKPANLFVSFGLVVCYVLLFYFIYKTAKKAK